MGLFDSFEVDLKCPNCASVISEVQTKAFDPGMNWYRKHDPVPADALWLGLSETAWCHECRQAFDSPVYFVEGVFAGTEEPARDTHSVVRFLRDAVGQQRSQRRIAESTVSDVRSHLRDWLHGDRFGSGADGPRAKPAEDVLKFIAAVICEEWVDDAADPPIEEATDAGA